jgi:putative oxidoreductase
MNFSGGQPQFIRKEITMSHTATHSTPAALSATSNAELAALILRVSMGFLFLAHAWLKISVFTPAGTAAFFESIGFPGPLAYVVIAAEVLGGIALILGTWTRWVSLALIPILLGSIYAPHGAAGFIFSNQGGGWEFPAFWAVALAVQALLGDGSYALKRNTA